MKKEYLKLGRKIRDKLNERGSRLDYFAGTIIAEEIEKQFANGLNSAQENKK